MSGPKPRRSYAQILALLGVLFAFSGFSEVLMTLDAELFEISVTPEQASSLDYDVDVDMDKLDEKQKDIFEDMLDEELGDRIPGWLAATVWVPYLLFGGLGLLALGGFYKWGRMLGALSLVGGLAMLGITIAADMILPAVLEAIGNKAMPSEFDVDMQADTGPALGRFQTGSMMIIMASLVALIRPDHRGTG